MPAPLPPLTRPQRLLLLGLFIQSAGLALLAWRRSSALNATIFLTLDAPEFWAVWVDRAGALLMTLSVAAFARWRKEGFIALVTFWTALLMGCSWFQNASYFEGLTPFAWGIRVGTPALVWWWLVFRPRERSPAGVLWGMRVVIAMTFATHGVEALRHHPRFIDLLLGSASRLHAGLLNQAQAESLLSVIGVVDVATAAGLLACWRWRGFPLWMAIWGAVTAASRVTQWGWSGMDHALLRVMHGGLPLVLYWVMARAPAEREDAS